MKFICDDNLGRLARWLRTLGYDTLFERDYADDTILTLALAEDRTILTRDSALATRVLARQVVRLSASDPLQQLAEVITATGVRVVAESMFSRCPECNNPVEQVDKEDYAESIPPYVYHTRDVFHRCPDCGRLYWDGTHTQRMRSVLHKAIGGTEGIHPKQ